MDEDEDALWKREWIENARLRTQPPLSRIVVAVDPAMSTGPTSSETGIVVVGADMRRQHAYVLADESGRLSPNNWALRVIHLYDKFNATMIVVEDNAGGQMAEATIQNAVTAPFRSRPSGRDAASTSGPSLSPPSTSRAESTTSVASPPSKTRCVPGTPTSARPNHPTAPTHSSTPSPSSSSTATPSTSGKTLSLTPYTSHLIPYTLYPKPQIDIRPHQRYIMDYRPEKEGIPMIPPQFEYFAPETLDEAISLLDKLGPEAVVLAGGQSLIPLMKLQLGRPRVCCGY